MPYTESDLLPLSALQHLLFCERQCALIHVERVWAENRFTAEGQILHRKAHDGKPETRDGVRITRGLPLHSFELGLSGQADVVLFQPHQADPPGVENDADLSTVSRADHQGRTLAQRLLTAGVQEIRHWTITPVEYKRGKPKSNDCDRVQLCAQAMCLEEMLDVSVPCGQLFYGQKRRRFDVQFDAVLRETTRRAAARLHQIVAAGETPTAVREKKCDTCSLLEICMPNVLGPRKSARRVFERQLEASLAEP